MKCLELFQYMDELGNYTDCKWFTSLNRTQLIKFVRELMDIWEYRAQLDDMMLKKKYVILMVIHLDILIEFIIMN